MNIKSRRHMARRLFIGIGELLTASLDPLLQFPLSAFSGGAFAQRVSVYKAGDPAPEISACLVSESKVQTRVNACRHNFIDSLAKALPIRRNRNTIPGDRRCHCHPGLVAEDKSRFC